MSYSFLKEEKKVREKQKPRNCFLFYEKEWVAEEALDSFALALFNFHQAEYSFLPLPFYSRLSDTVSSSPESHLLFGR